MTRCAGPSLFAGIASFLSERTGGRFRLIIGYETPEKQDAARDGAAITEAAGGHALLMPRPLPAPLTAFSVRMVMADGAVYVTASGKALIYLGGRAVDRAREGALAPDADLSLIDEAVAARSDDTTIARAQEGWESVGEGMIGAYVDRAAARITDLWGTSPVGVSVSCEEGSGIMARLLERLEIPVSGDAALALRVSSDGRRLECSIPDAQVRAALAPALASPSPIPDEPGMFCVDPAFVLDADALCAGAALAAMYTE